MSSDLILADTIFLLVVLAASILTRNFWKS
jgi:hypothetical protein